MNTGLVRIAGGGCVGGNLTEGKQGEKTVLQIKM